ncbi:hypothetical protein VaNZ11_009026 [Volvox africanus]|uniref:Uncharacterized protein n=1 Tax=Volvox africanus TaxID=51714 RepID=A0ABQ5S6F2_9CHLO|nr:hypothetical protein VaNZ11_009026 [Volvox africanus]
MEELERCLASLDGSPSAEVLARARSAAETIKQELEMHKEAAATRQKTGQDWQTIASERETETVRLRAEINRMRQAIASSTQAHGSQAEEIASLQAQLQEALAINKAQQRQAVVTTSAVDGPNAELYRLRAELEGRTGQLQQMEADLANQRAVAATRLNEMQDTFSNKITEMRRMHQQQLEQAVAAARAAAASEAQGRTGPRAGAAALEQQNAQRLQRAEADVASLRQQLEAAQAASTELQGKLKQAQSDAESSRSQLTSAQFGEKALKARVKELEGQLAKTQQQVKEQQKNESQPPPPPPPPPPAKEAPAVDLSMLNMMEGQLGRLSEIIRSREGELAQMRAALQAGLDERKELLQQIEMLQTALLQAQQQLQLQQQQQQHYGSAPGSSNGSINGGGGGGSVSGLSSPKSSSGAVPRGLPLVGQHKPNRTGLQSKPRFFK